jgi:hypothetical protein
VATKRRSRYFRRSPTFDWSGGNIEQDDDRFCIPGQIVFFLEVTKEMVGIDVGGEMILP